MDMDTERGGLGIGRWTTVAVCLVLAVAAVGVVSVGVTADSAASERSGTSASAPTAVAGAENRENATTISLGRAIDIRNPGADEHGRMDNWYKVYVGDRGALLRINYTGDGSIIGQEGAVMVGHEVNGTYQQWQDGNIGGYSTTHETTIPKPIHYIVKDSGYVYINTYALDGTDMVQTFTVTTESPDAGVYGVTNVSVVPATARPGQEVTVTADVTYSRTEVVNPERAVTRFTVDGGRQGASNHSIDLGGTKTVQFTHETNYTDATGSHDVTVEALPAWAVEPDLQGTTDATTYTLEASDVDDDGLYDFREEQGETDKTDPDTDDDGLQDGREIELGTTATNPDTDGDGLQDGREVELGTDPTDTDTDDDGLTDAREVELGTNATKADTDEDGLDDAQEVDLGTDPTNPDTDGDGTADGAEIEQGTDPTVDESEDADTTPDAGSADGSDGGGDGTDGSSDGSGADADTVGGGENRNAVTAGGSSGGLPLPVPGVPVLAGVLVLGLAAGGGALYARRRSRRKDYERVLGASGGSGTSTSGTSGGGSGSTGGSGTTAGSDVSGARSATGASTAGAAAAGVGGPDTDGSSGGEYEYDDFEIGDRIGAGGNADVFRATAPDGSAVAIKQPRIEGTVGTDTIEQFVGEAEQWAALDDGEYIVDVVGWGTQPLPWLGMEYMAGGSLAEHDLGALDFGDAVGISLAAVNGVRHAHEYGVVHHDLKPANVLLSDDASPDVKVADWGLSKLLLEHSGSVEGLSPQYAAPEQFDPDRFGTPDKRTDIYQLGAVCYELFTGGPPFEGDQSTVMYSTLEKDVPPPTRVDPKLPGALDDVLLKALAKDPDERYESVLYLRDDLAAFTR